VDRRFTNLVFRIPIFPPTTVLGIPAARGQALRTSFSHAAKETHGQIAHLQAALRGSGHRFPAAIATGFEDLLQTGTGIGVGTLYAVHTPFKPASVEKVTPGPSVCGGGGAPEAARADLVRQLAIQATHWRLVLPHSGGFRRS